MPDATTRYAFILNPRSGNGRAGKQWARLEPLVRERIGDVRLYTTETPGHATELARTAIGDGAQRVISCGGDGTHFEVINGFFDDGQSVSSDVALGVLPLGTGSDLPRTLRVPRDPFKAIPFLDSPSEVLSDVGKMTATDPETGEAVTTYFLSSCHVGFGGAICEYVNNHTKVLGGRLTFLMALLAVGAGFKPVRMKIESGDQTREAELVETIAANGQFDGGGMNVAPHARLNNGTFETYTMPDLGPIQSLLNIPRLYKGTQDQHPDIDRFACAKLRIESDPPVLAAVDGEIGGATPLTLEIVPEAVRLITGPDPPVI